VDFSGEHRMRADMKHVIIDRPRLGGEGGKSRPPKGSKRRWQRMPVEDFPRAESTARRRLYGSACKGLNEHLSPLRRWLRSQCGRRWDDVYAEICEGLSVRNATTAHVRDHAEKFVVQDTRLIDGVVCDSRGQPVRGWRWQPFLVHPRDGTLREAPPSKRYCLKPQEPNFVVGEDALRQYRLIKGVWYEIELWSRPVHYVGYLREEVTETVLLSRPEVVQSCERPVYAKSKRQLGKAEIRKRKLWESPLGKRARLESGILQTS
jgi:hypothetical protein